MELSSETRTILGEHSLDPLREVDDRFGPASAAAIVGASTVGQAATAVATPVVLRLLRPATGGYTVPLLLLGGVVCYRSTAPVAGA